MDNKIINERIRDRRLLIIDEDGSKLGAMDRDDAIELAQSKDLDLVLFVPASKTGSLPIAKIIDFGKYSYELKMKEKQSKKKQSVIKVKEIKVKPQIGAHDLKWRAENAKEWLSDDCQVRFKIQAYGRIGSKPELIEEVYKKFLELIGDIGKIQTPLKKLTPVLYESLIVKNK